MLYWLYINNDSNNFISQWNIVLCSEIVYIYGQLNVGMTKVSGSNW